MDMTRIGGSNMDMTKVGGSNMDMTRAEGEGSNMQATRVWGNDMNMTRADNGMEMTAAVGNILQSRVPDDDDTMESQVQVKPKRIKRKRIKMRTKNPKKSLCASA